MLMQAYNNGARAAAEHFGVREASVLSLLSSAAHYIPELAATAAAGKVIGALKGVGQDVARTVAPKAYSAVSRPIAAAGAIADLPEQALRRNVLPAALQRSPEELLLRGLAGAPGPSPRMAPSPTAIHGRLT